MNFGDARVGERMWSRCIPEPNTGCWIWIGNINDNGYGILYNLSTGLQERAHRLMYVALVGDIPTGLDIDHLCRVRCCVNPAHLEPVTRSVNVSRGLSPQQIATFHKSKTHCPSGHPYDDKNTGYRGAHRYCKACNRAAQARYQSRMK